MLSHLLGTAFSAAVRLRSQLYNAKLFSTVSFSVPTISIGNLSVGGSGKTPLVAALLKDIIGRGKTPILLSRGYGRLDTREQLIPPKFEVPGPGVIGDEPFMLKRKFPEAALVVHSDRASVAKRRWNELRGDVVVLDDAFQHWTATRNLDIVTIDLSKAMKDILLPVGQLREHWRALDRADALVFTRTDEIDPDLARRRSENFFSYLQTPPVDRPWRRSTVTNPAVFWSRYAIQGLYDKNGTKLEDSVWGNRNCIGIAGVGNPNSARRTFESIGISLINWRAYKDHQELNQSILRELRQLKRAHQDLEPVFITTEKDAARWEQAWPADLGELWHVKIDVEFATPAELRFPLEDWQKRFPGIEFSHLFLSWIQGHIS